MERMVSLMSAESPRSSQTFIGHNTLAALFGLSLPISISVPAIKNDWAMGRMRLIGRDESHVRSWLPVTLGSSTFSVCAPIDNVNVALFTTGTCTVTANQSGSTLYGAAP